MKSHRLALIALLAAFLIIAAGTGGDRPLRLGVLDPVSLRQQSKSLSAEMEKLAVPSRQLLSELQLKQAALSKDLEEFGRQRTALSEDSARKQSDALQAQAREVQELSRRLEENMKKAESEGLSPMRQRVGKAVGELARERGLSLVLTADSVIFNTADLDLTGAVAAKLDGAVK